MASCLSHFSHHHELVKTQTSASGRRFYCDLCNTRIKKGPRYRCHECDFDLHEDCAKLPETISFFAHPWHNLHLGPGGEDGQVCDLCMEVGTGFFYRCISCGFDVHPHCTATKQTVCTELHPEHTLFLLPTSPSNSCTACMESGDSIWLYRCGICNVNLHMECLHGPIKPKVSNANNSSSREGSSSSVGRFVRQVAVETLVNSLTDLL